jgi:hypothetical protein
MPPFQRVRWRADLAGLPAARAWIIITPAIDLYYSTRPHSSGIKVAARLNFEHIWPDILLG